MRAPYLFRRGARVYLRVRIPNRLRATVTGREIVRALATSDLQLARRRGGQAVAGIQAGFGIMDHVHRDGSLEPGTRRDLLDRIIARAMTDPEGLIAQERALDGIVDPALLRRCIQELAENFHATVAAREAERDRANQLAQNAEGARAAAERKAAQADHKAESLRVTMAQLVSSGVAEIGDLADGHDQSVAALKDAFLAAKGLKPKTEKSYRKAFSRFEAVVGTTPISEITKNQVVRFVEDLEATRSDKRNRDPLDPATSQKYLSHIKTFFDEAKAKNRVRTNPAEGVGVTRKASRPDEERSPFTPTELQAILDTPLYRGCHSLARIHRPGQVRCRDGRFWYGLLMLFTTATGLVADLAKAHTAGRLEDKLRQYAKPRLPIVDELGYLPFDTESAHLFFQLVSRRYERGSMIVTSNRSIGDWGSIFSDAVVATAILDRILHHSHVIAIRGESYRLREKRRAGLLQQAGPATAAADAAQ